MKIVSLIGRSGCGKGTQLEKLVEKTGWEPIYTGKLIRKRSENEDFIGKKLKEVTEQGGIVPTPLVFNIWMPKLTDVRRGKIDTSGIVFDGNPRKLYEAKMLEEVFDMFEWSDFFIPIHIKISEEEAKRRLLKRGRVDDNEAEIKNRLSWFKTDVLPVLNYYKEKGILIEVDGEQSIEKVQEDILEVLNLK